MYVRPLIETSYSAREHVNSTSAEVPGFGVSSVSILEDILLNDVRSAIRTSVFTSDIAVLRHSLRLHAIDGSDMTIRECRYTLLNHIFRGACVDHQPHIHCGTVRRDITACRYIGADFLSSSALVSSTIELITSATKETLPIDNLRVIIKALGIITGTGYSNNRRSKLLDALKAWPLTNNELNILPEYLSLDLIIRDIETLPRASLISMAARHQIKIPAKTKASALRSILVAHITGGHCRTAASLPSSAASGCIQTMQNVPDYNEFDDDGSRTALKIKILTTLAPRLSVRPLKRLLNTYNLEFPVDASRGRLRRILRHHIKGLIRGKTTPYSFRQAEAMREETEHNRKKQELIDAWPTLVSSALQDTTFHL